MVLVLIVSDDKDVADLLSLLLDQAGYSTIRTKTVTEFLQNSATFEFIILDHPYNLTPEDWTMLKKMKEERGNLPIAVTNSPPTPWLLQKSRELEINKIFSYPCDLTVELPTFLDAYFGS